MARPIPAAEHGATVLAGEGAHIVVAFDDNRLVPELFGEFDQNLAMIEQRLGVDMVARGNQVTIRGRPEACDAGASRARSPLRPPAAGP